MRPVSLFFVSALLLAAAVLHAETPARPPAPWEVKLDSTAPSGVAYVGEAARERVTVSDHASDAPSAELTLSLHPLDGKGAEVRRTIALKAGGMAEEDFDLPTDLPGYWGLTAMLRVGGQETARTEGAFAVVQHPRSEGKEEPDGFFGAMFVHDPQAGMRIGIKSERVQAYWRWIERDPAKLDWSEIDAQVDKLKQAGIAVVLTIRPDAVPVWAEWKSLEQLSLPKYLPDFKQFVSEAATHYRGRLQAIEILNEPDLSCAADATGKVPLADICARLQRAGYEAVKETDPNLTVLGVGVSGVDFTGPDYPLPFASAVLARQAGYLDAISGHPYSFARYIGDSFKPESPLKAHGPERLEALATAMKKHQMKPRIWSTEWGWGLAGDEGMVSPAARTFAAITAQALILARTAPDVEKLFWFSATFPGLENDCSYGMFRGDPLYPTAAAVTYATCARVLDAVTFVNRQELGPSCYEVEFKETGTGRGIFALWTEAGTAQARLPFADCKGATVEDILGRAVPPATPLPVGPLPLFVTLAPEDVDHFEKALIDAQVEAGTAVEMKRAYLTSLSNLRIELKNNTRKARTVHLSLAGSPPSPAIQLPIGESAYDLPLSTTSPRPPSVTAVVKDEETGTEIPTVISLDLLPALPIARSVIDGNIDKARDLQEVIVATRDRVLPADPEIDWKGPYDLSAMAWMGWTVDGIYLAVKVSDDLHVVPSTDLDTFWQSDSLQVAFDFGNRAEGAFDEHCREYGFVLGKSGATVIETYPGHRRVDAIPAMIVRKGSDSTTIYETVIPWHSLGITKPKPGDVFGMDFIVNDNDGRGRKCWIGMTPGIGESKRPELYRRWVLER